MKKIKSYLVSVLSAALLLSCMVGCSNNTVGVESAKTNKTSSDIKQKKISDEGYGRQEYSVGGLQFRVGETVQEFIDRGFEVSERETEKEIDAGGFQTLRLRYNSDKKSYSSLYAYILNDSDSKKAVFDCRVICVFDNIDISAKDKFEVSVTKKEDIESTYNVQDLMIETELSYATDRMDVASDNDLGYGTSFNHIKFHFDKETNVLIGVQILYCEHLLSEVEIPNMQELGYFTQIAMASALAPYFDTAEYLNNDIHYTGTDLPKKFDVGTLTVTLNGIDINFGDVFETYKTLKDKGVVFLREEDMVDIEPNSYRGYRSSKGILSIGDGIITDVGFGNHESSETVSWEDARMTSIEIENPIAVSTANSDAPSLNFYGVTEKSTITDIINILGKPASIDSSYHSPSLAELNYQFFYPMIVCITVDVINNNIYSLSVYTKG